MPKKQKYETAVLRLEEIVSLLESSDTSLDDSIKLYKEGITLAALCTEKLTEAEGEIAVLRKMSTGLFRKENLQEIG